jgi:DNA-binding MarR family transcriptional regulator
VRNHAALANDAWEALLSSHASVMKSFASEKMWDEVSMREYDVLYALSKQDSPISLNELHRRVLLSQPAMSRMVDRLVARGLVLRDSDVRDARALRLSLTAEGRDCQRRVGRKHARSVVRATSELSAEELETLEKICKKLGESQR